jgi:hypothetical protein
LIRLAVSFVGSAAAVRAALGGIEVASRLLRAVCFSSLVRFPSCILCKKNRVGAPLCWSGLSVDFACVRCVLWICDAHVCSCLFGIESGLRMLGVRCCEFSDLGDAFCCRFCQRRYFAVLTAFWARMCMLSRDLG